MPWVVFIILVLLLRKIGCCSWEWEMTPRWERGQHPAGPREICCSSTRGWVCLHGCLRQRGDTVLTSTAAGRAEAAPMPRKTPDTHQTPPELLPPAHTALFAKNKCTCFLPATLSAKGNPNTFPPLLRRGHIFCTKKKKEKKKITGKSQQKETTSVGCKMTKRKANECPGRGPAIAEKYNLEGGSRGAFAAKHMSGAVPGSVCLLPSRSQLKALRALQAFFQLWPRDCRAKGLFHLHEDCAWGS